MWPKGTALRRISFPATAASAAQRVAWKKCNRRESAADAHSEEQDLAGFAHPRDPRYAAARLWVDAIIGPAETRNALIWALEAAALNPERREFKTGVPQT